MFTIRTSSGHYKGDIDSDGYVKDSGGRYHNSYRVDGDYVYEGCKKVGYFDNYGRYIDSSSGRTDYYRC